MKNENKNIRNKKLERAWVILCVAAFTIINTTTTVFANAIAEAGAKWILDGIFWIVLVAGIFGAGMSGIKRNLTAALGIVIATALICVVCQNPEIIPSLGNTFKGILGL